MPVIVVLALWLGLFIGWTAAHHEVSAECQRLGAFYVSQKTFECKESKK